MKTTFEADSEEEARRILRSAHLCAVILEMREQFRKDYKYGTNAFHGEHWQDVLHETLRDHSVDLEDIWT